MVYYSVALSDDAKNRIKGTSLSDKNDFFYGGIILTAVFKHPNQLKRIAGG